MYVCIRVPGVPVDPPEHRLRHSPRVLSRVRISVHYTVRTPLTRVSLRHRHRRDVKLKSKSKLKSHNVHVRAAWASARPNRRRSWRSTGSRWSICSRTSHWYGPPTGSSTASASAPPLSSVRRSAPLLTDLFSHAQCKCTLSIVCTTVIWIWIQPLGTHHLARPVCLHCALLFNWFSIYLSIR